MNSQKGAYKRSFLNYNKRQISNPLLRNKIFKNKKTQFYLRAVI